jgi:Spy/CpxP family protein refolding chaperone
MQKIKNITALTIILGLFLFQNAYAGGAKMHGYDKAIKKAHFALQYEDELGLTDEQVAQIRILKADAEKDLIRKKADIDLVEIDIQSQMYEDTIDLDAINALIDKKYELKKAKAKASVRSYADLKNVLTDEQKEKMRSLYRGKYQSGCRSDKHDSKKRPVPQSKNPAS